MAETIEIGWCFKENKSSSIYFEPEPNNPLKDAISINHSSSSSKSVQGVRACPAVKSVASKIWLVRSPYSIKLRAKIEGSKITIIPLYPSTEVSEESLAGITSIEPRELWLDNNKPIIQFKMPYIFVSDRPAIIHQLEAPMNSRRKNWSLIQGEIDIYNWQRPLNFAIQWTEVKQDLEIRRGDPAFQLMASSTEQNSGFNLRKINPCQALKNRIEACEGVTSLVRNTKSLIHSSRPENQTFLKQ